ncbi:MAG: NrfD/PsrC family molybdoenzyme membrane anchor subunit [Candidatus Neomarinimicrobiota bacterium]
MNHSDSITADGVRSQSLGRFLLNELKPKGEIFTPFNLISVPVIILGLIIIFIRFWKGLGAVTNLSQTVPWGLWIGFDVVTGVAFAGGAYVLTFMVYVLNIKKYEPIVRVTVLNGFLAYLFYAGALLLDLGRPWNVINPIIGNSFGTSSVLFLVAWHFMLYMFATLIEFSPAIAEWLGMERIRRILKSLTVGAVIFGITLSTLHQSGLGAPYLMAKDKIHPLWYTEFIPILFFVSSIFAGLSMVIFEGSITYRVFSHQVSKDDHRHHNALLFGLAKVCAGAMFVYLFLKLLILAHEQQWSQLSTGFGNWYLLEIIGFVLLPMILFISSIKQQNLILVKIASVLTLVGIILNRLNVTVIGFHWDAAVRYVPTWMEIVVTLAIIFIEIWVFRWIVNRMPVLNHAIPATRAVKISTD